MRLTRKQKITSVTAACAVGALAVIGGTYATFTDTDTAPVQSIASASSGLTFTDNFSAGFFAATYSNLAAGDSLVSYISLRNSGTNTLELFKIKQVSTGDTAGMGAVGSEGLSVQIDRSTAPGADTLYGTADDIVTPVIAKMKMATLATQQAMVTAPVASNEVANLRFTITMDPLAVVQNKSLSTVYTVDANQHVGP